MDTTFFESGEHVYLVLSDGALSEEDCTRLTLVLDAHPSRTAVIEGSFVGPRREMVTPWSTNATDIAVNIGLKKVKRIEQFRRVESGKLVSYDPMLEASYTELDAKTLDVTAVREPDEAVSDIKRFNEAHALALSAEEVVYLEKIADSLGRPLSDSELYGFAQINSEHCRHKIFNGSFVIDGTAKDRSLFDLIKETSRHAPRFLVSAYRDNVAFITGPEIEQFAPASPVEPSEFRTDRIRSVLSLKAETHNFPTTVEPFYGASTGSGGEIRDRMAGGRGSIPLVGTAVYMTAYPRMKGGRSDRWERHTRPRDWKYQTPSQILLKASNGASDFGNKFGQPLINGSLLTFEADTPRAFYGYDRVIMLAGGVGYARADHAEKDTASVGDMLVLLGGDNYRIGMAGGSVSSVDTGAVAQSAELSAVQRANPEMQKRVFNVIRALAEVARNPIKLIHDHGAGGHMNCFCELLEPLGGKVMMSQLPVGDPTLSSRELLCNESQERMGLIVAAADIPLIQRIAEREGAPCYVVGQVTGDERLVFERSNDSRPVDLPMSALLGSSPKTVLTDETIPLDEVPLEFSLDSGAALESALEDVLSLEGVACKDWLTNKVDRSVTGRVAQQQCVGPLQLPLANLGVVTLDYRGTQGIGTAVGHAPAAGLIDERAGSILAIAESLTNLIWAPFANGLESVALSANWMWPCKQQGENARLYRAVEACSKFAQELGIAIPTGKDSLSMTMGYADGTSVRAPGTVVISAVAEISDIRKIVTPDLKPVAGSWLAHIDLSGCSGFPLGGSAFAQTLGRVGDDAPSVLDAKKFAKGLQIVQELINEGKVLAGHDVSSGGLITTLCEMAFAGDTGFEIAVGGSPFSVTSSLFCEKPGVVLQLDASLSREICERFRAAGLPVATLGEVRGSSIKLHAGDLSFSKSVHELRQVWFKPSYLLDSKQTKPAQAKERYERFGTHHLELKPPEWFTGDPAQLGISRERTGRSGIVGAIIRDKGTNGDRELAYAMHISGFDVRDVTMSDLTSGRETLEDVRFVAFPGGFSRSDVLGAGRGWAATFHYNDRALGALERFYRRPDTLSVGVCNGCQLVAALGFLHPDHREKFRMEHNDSGKFESIFLSVRVQETASVMLKPLVGSTLGIWVAHGEGMFIFPEPEASYDIPLKYVSSHYPANPNGSYYNAAAVVSADGRHLALMPHLERSIFMWQWGWSGYPKPKFELSPWLAAFVEARRWIERQ